MSRRTHQKSLAADIISSMMLGVGIILLSFSFVGLFEGPGSVVCVFVGIGSIVYSLMSTFGGKEKKRSSPRRKLFDPDAKDHAHITAPPLSRFNRPDSGFDPMAKDHNHIRSSPVTQPSGTGSAQHPQTVAHNRERDLQQLETMLSAGLIEKPEYHMRKQKILDRYRQ